MPTVLKKRPMDGFDVVVDEADITKWAVTIHGPPGTDFEGKPKCTTCSNCPAELLILFHFWFAFFVLLSLKAAFSMRCSLFQKTILFHLLR